MLKTIKYIDYPEDRSKAYANIVLRELSSGVYYVEKDRTGELPEYISASGTVTCLRGRDKVMMTDRDKKTVYANFDIALCI